jgi:type IX secretion system PorP/SprF family membrane protein
MQRIALISFLFLGLVVGLSAQQEEQYTQFMYHKMGFNPAYAGVPETGCFSILAREQWMGFDGAPSSQLVTFNMPLTSAGIGIGATLGRHTIGFEERIHAEVDYAYRINVGAGGRLGFGLSTSVRLHRVDYNQADPIQAANLDGSIPVGVQSKYLPNFGAGIYYNNPTFYVGLSAPRLIENNIDLANDATILSREVRHIFAMGGVLFPLGEKLKLQPQVLLKLVKGAPFDADTNINLIFNDRLYTGISYRIGGSSQTGIGESASALFGMEINRNLKFGLAYDFTLSELRDYTGGSLELVIQYCLQGRSEGESILSPRMF